MSRLLALGHAFSPVTALLGDEDLVQRTPDLGEAHAQQLDVPVDPVPVEEPTEEEIAAVVQQLEEVKRNTEALAQHVQARRQAEGLRRYMEDQAARDPQSRIASPVGAYRGGRMDPKGRPPALQSQARRARQAQREADAKAAKAAKTPSTANAPAEAPGTSAPAMEG